MKHSMHKKMSLMDMAKAGRMGDDGVKDTRLAHINEHEDKILRFFGGEGSINPKTGLPEYKGGGGGSSATGRDRGGPGGTSRSGPDKGDSGGKPRGGGGASTGRPVGSTANQSERVSEYESNKMGGANTSVDIDKRVRDFLNYEKPGVLPQIADFTLGPWFDIPDPVVTDPQTYYDGTWHSKTNVPGVVGGLLGGFAGGPIGSQIGSQFGGAVGEYSGIGQVPHNPWGGDSLSHIAESGGLGSAPGWGGGGFGGGPSNAGGDNGNHGNQNGLLGGQNMVPPPINPTPGAAPVIPGPVQPSPPRPTPIFNYNPISGGKPYGVNLLFPKRRAGF